MNHYNDIQWRGSSTTSHINHWVNEVGLAETGSWRWCEVEESITNSPPPRYNLSLAARGGPDGRGPLKTPRKTPWNQISTKYGNFRLSVVKQYFQNKEKKTLKFEKEGKKKKKKKRKQRFGGLVKRVKEADREWRGGRWKFKSSSNAKGICIHSHVFSRIFRHYLERFIFIITRWFSIIDWNVISYKSWLLQEQFRPNYMKHWQVVLVQTNKKSI